MWNSRSHGRLPQSENANAANAGNPASAGNQNPFSAGRSVYRKIFFGASAAMLLSALMSAGLMATANPELNGLIGHGNGLSNGDNGDDEQALQLSEQSRNAVDAVQESLETVRSRMIAFHRLRQVEARLAMGAQSELASSLQAQPLPGSRPDGGLLYYAHFQLNAGGGVTLQASSWSSGVPDSFESKNLARLSDLAKRAAQAVSRSDTSDKKLSQASPLVVDTLPSELRPSRELVALAFAQSSTEILVGMGEAEALFPFFTRYGARELRGSVRTYLLGSKGRVLTHSLAGMVGADFSTYPIYQDAISLVLRGLRLQGLGQFNDKNQDAVRAAYSRVGDHPLVVVVERILPVRAQGIASGLGKMLAALLCLMTGAWVASALARVARRAVESEIKIAFTELPSQGAVVAKETAVEVPISLPAQVEEAVNSLQEKQADRSAAQSELSSAGTEFRRTLKEHQLLDQFEAEQSVLKDPVQAARRLTRVTAELCESPTLFFTYHDQKQLASLFLQEGLQEGLQAGLQVGLQGTTSGKSTLPRLQFPVTEEFLKVMNTAAEAQAASGITGDEKDREQLISVSHYEPLAQLLLAKFGVAHFDAYLVTGFTPLGRALNRPTLLGVLVILKAGAASAFARDALARMMRCTGRVYENAVGSV